MKQGNDLKLVTAASPGHFRSLLQFLKSVRRYEPTVTCLVYGMKLDDIMRDTLRSKNHNCDYRDFDFAMYPEFLDIDNNNGAYAWKPAIIWDAMAQTKGPVCWMDSGNTLVSSLDGIRSELARTGFYSPYSPGSMAEWTHPGMLSSIGIGPDWNGTKRNLNGACIAFDPLNERALRLAREWKDYALVKQCIAPEGSDRSNHRYDQALLSILAYRDGMVEGIEHGYLGFKPHQDVEGKPARAALRALRRLVEFWAYKVRQRVAGRGSARKLRPQ
jgi:hypothetical protein